MPRFKLTRLFWITTLVALLTTFGLRYRQSAVQQAAAVKKVRTLQGAVIYRHKHTNNQFRHTELPLRIYNSIGLDWIDHPVVLDFWETGYFPSDPQEFQCFTELKSVHTIKCFDGPVDPTAIPALDSMPQLRSLSLQRSGFDSDEAISGLRELNHLEELTLISELPEAGFTNDGVRALQLAQWTHLKRLTIGSQGLTNESLADICSPPRLESLCLACFSPIDDQALPYLLKLTELEELDVRYTAMSNESIQRLGELLPKCDVKLRNKR